MQYLNLKAAGLWLTSNPLDAPPGALSVADNVVIRRKGIVESRRGQAPDATVPDDAAVRSMAAFEGGVLAHTSAGKLVRRDSDVAVTPYDGTYQPPAGFPMRFAEAGGGLYFTTSTGLYRLDSLTGEPEEAGVPPGLEGSAALTGSTGWLATGDGVAYRLVWGTRDNDGTLMLGAPSGRIIVTNAAGAGRDVVLSAPIPPGVVEGRHFLQAYRTNTVAASIDPGEDYAQVAEVYPNASDLAAGFVTVSDIASFPNGPSAYFSQNTGVTIAGALDKPPLLTDMVVYKGHVFGVVNKYRETFFISLLAVGGADGLGDLDGLTLFTPVEETDTSETFTASTAYAEGTTITTRNYAFVLSSAGTAAQNIEATARSLVRVINSKSVKFYATYASSSDEFPGKVIITRRDFSSDVIQVGANNNDKPWAPALKMQFGGSAVRVSNVVTVTTGTPHHLAVDEVIEQLAPPTDPDFPPGTKIVTSVPTSTTFTYAEVGPDASSPGEAYATKSPYGTFNQEADSGSWAHSAYEEFDGWPGRYRFRVGGPSATLYRITPQGDALLFWTSEGLYRLTGNDETDFTLRPLDPTVRLVAPNTVVTMGNRVFALTEQGVVAVSDLGVDKVSEELDEAILQFYAGAEGLKELTEQAAFGIAYEAENEYILFLPDDAGDEGDPAAQAYVLNTQTGTWVRWVFNWSGINGDTGWVTTGIVPAHEGRLYLASGDRLTRERKSRNLSDYQDTTGVGVPADVCWQVQTAMNPGSYKHWSEVLYFVEKPMPTTVGVYFTTEIDENPEGGTITTNQTGIVRTYIPRNKSRSSRLFVGIQANGAQEKLSLQGLSIVYTDTSQRVSR